MENKIHASWRAYAMGDIVKNKYHDDPVSHSNAGRVGGRRTQARKFEDYPLTLEQAARYIKVPLGKLREGLRVGYIGPVAAPKVEFVTGRIMYFTVAELDSYNKRVRDHHDHGKN